MTTPVALMRMRRHRGSERGSAAIEAVLVLPALLLFAGLVIAAGRLAIAHQSVELAAAESARSASLAPSADQAKTVATTAATDTLTGRHLHCTTASVTIDTTAFATPVGTAAQVRSQVVCVVDLSDVALPGLPGSVKVDAVGESPLDRYRERQG